ncbi:MAG: hypothetical protein U0136_06840 [Bdellovibrionota bacterium]
MSSLKFPRLSSFASGVIPGLGIAALCAALAWFFLLAPKGKSFPMLREGTYVGTIIGLDGSPPTGTGVYAERIAGTNSLLVVLFASGWTPQAVELKPQSKGGDFRPLAVTYHGQSYTLSGSGSGDQFAGELAGAGGTRGTWSLQSIASASLKAPKTTMSDADLKSWLQAKVTYNTAKDELVSLKSTHEQEASKFEKLTRFVQDENVLKDRSRSRIDELESEINRVAAERKKSTQDLKNALNDLSLLTKTTKRGQVVDLNRRIQRRENKWFGINWSSEAADSDSAAGLEADLAEKEQVDLRKLNSEVKRAEEIRKLQTTIAQEQSRIEQLRAAYDQKLHSVEAPPPPATAPGEPRRPPVEQEEQKPWWKKLDGILG